MQNNIKIITDVEINECLLKLSEVLKLYLPSVKEEEISVSINRLAPEAAKDLIDSMK